MGRAKMDILEEIKRLPQNAGVGRNMSYLYVPMFHSLQYQHGMVKAKFQRCFHWEKICEAFDITLSQFFSGGEDMVYITEEQRKLLDRWSALTRKQQELFLELFESI